MENDLRKPCTATNCVGVTLESELGIHANSVSGPDLEWWEVKAHTVRSFASATSGVITLMTPEPTGGFYRDAGVERFVARYGYEDTMGRVGRRNFGGIHKVGEVARKTQLRMILTGYDVEDRRITNSGGSLALVDANDVVAAEWSFSGLLQHWSRKHMNAVYVPALKRTDHEGSLYQFGSTVLCATGTDYLKLLPALASGTVFLDPGVKVVTTDEGTQIKRRNQFRTKFSQVASLYDQCSLLAACGPSDA